MCLKISQKVYMIYAIWSKQLSNSQERAHLSLNLSHYGAMKVGDISNHTNQKIEDKVIKGNILKFYEVNQQHGFTKHLDTKHSIIITFVAPVADFRIE